MKKQQIIYSALAVVLGELSMHRFYAGKFVEGIIRLLLFGLFISGTSTRVAVSLFRIIAILEVVSMFVYTPTTEPMNIVDTWHRFFHKNETTDTEKIPPMPTQKTNEPFRPQTEAENPERPHSVVTKINKETKTERKPKKRNIV